RYFIKFAISVIWGCTANGASLFLPEKTSENLRVYISQPIHGFPGQKFWTILYLSDGVCFSVRSAGRMDDGKRRIYDEPVCKMYSMEYMGMASDKKEAETIADKLWR